MESINKTIENLKRNNINAVYAPDVEAVKSIVRAKVSNKTVAFGGSQTLVESGIIDMLRQDKSVTLLDWLKAGLSAQEKDALYIKNFGADIYLSSANAVTENGEIYNVDGRGNRVACISYGCKEVLIIAGKNKIVPALPDAVMRVKTIAAPKNAVRLNYDTYCRRSGSCVSLKNSGSEMTDGCCSNGRICCNYSILGFQKLTERFKVVIVGTPLGY